MARKHVKYLVLVAVLALILVSAAAMAQTPVDAVADCVANSGVFPFGTTVVSTTINGSSAVVDLSAEALLGLDDTQSDAMVEAIANALGQFPEITAIEVTIGGKPTSTYLPAPSGAEMGSGQSGGNVTVQSVGAAPKPMAAQNPLLPPSVAPTSNELAGKLVVLHPSHGSYASTSSWYRAQRTFSGPNAVTNNPPGRTPKYQPSDYYFWTKGFQWPMYYEDDMSPETIRFLYAYCQSAGAATFCSRNLDKTAGNFPWATYGYPNPGFTLPKWMTAAKYALQDRGGIPSSVWQTTDVTGESNIDIRARPYYANWLMSTLGYDKTNSVSFSLHSNASNTCSGSAQQAQARGTETYWYVFRKADGYSSDDPYGVKTQAIAFCNAMEASVINSIRNQYDGYWAEAIYNATTTPVPPEWCTSYGTYRGYVQDGTSLNRWQDRGVKTSDFGEIRNARMPAQLMELLFHDDWKFYPDQAFHQDGIFRATVAWGMYAGICNYFGVTPKPMTDASVDSVTFPAFVKPGAAITGTVSMKNLGMAWCWGNKMVGALYVPYTVWALKGTSDDQFGAAGTKIQIANDGNYYPGDVASFNISLTAPADDGYYTTKWQMRKDDGKGGDFGAVASAQIGVDGTAPDITITAPEAKWYNGDAITAGFSATDAMSGVDTVTANVDGTDIANGDSLSLANGSHTLTVTAKDKVGNEATKSVTFNVDKDAPVITITSPTAALYPYGPVAINFTASDALSGLASVSATVDGAAVISGQTISTLGVGAHTLVVTAKDNVGNTATQQVDFTVVSTVGKVTVGGWIELANKKGTCGFVCEYVAGAAAPTGNLTYQDHDTGMTIQSIKYDGMGIVGNHAWLYGTCTVDGQGEHVFRVDVIDNGEPGSNDVFNIQLDTGYSKGDKLGGGNVTIH